MKVFESKIFLVKKLNFMQYIPIFLMTNKNEKTSKLFTEKFLSFLIVKTFNCVSKEHITVRQ